MILIDSFKAFCVTGQQTDLTATRAGANMALEQKNFVLKNEPKQFWLNLLKL